MFLHKKVSSSPRKNDNLYGCHFFVAILTPVFAISPPGHGRTQKNDNLSGCRYFGAENGARTRDLNLGKVALYQLSYFRNITPYLAVGITKVRSFF